MEGKNNVKKNIIIVESIIIIVLLLYISIILLGTNRDKNHSNTTVTTGNKSTDSSIKINKSNEEQKNDTIKLNLNEIVIKENKYELTVLGTNFAKTILPPNTSSYYSYYEAKTDGHQYLEVKYNYKNLGESNVRADNVVSMTIKYDDKYEYTGFCIIEDDECNFTYANITNISPLTTGKLHYLFDIPDEVANSDNSIVAIMKCGSDIYEVKLR